MATQTPTVDVPQSFPSAIADVDGLVAALAAKEATANKGAASGYMGLGADGYAVPAQLGAGNQLAGSRVAPASASAAGAESAAHFSAVAALGTMSTQAASAVAITGGTIAGVTELSARDTSAAFDVQIEPTSTTALTAKRKLTLDVDNAARTLALKKSLTVQTGDVTLTGDVAGSVLALPAGTTTLASMSTQAANAVAITGGTATGLTQLATTAACTALLGGAAASAQSSLAISASKTIAVPAAISVWRGLDFQASTLTLTAGGVAPSSLSAAYFAAPVITQTAGAAYTVPVAATVTIAGPPTASAGGGATPTLTSAAALIVASGKVGIGTNVPTTQLQVGDASAQVTTKILGGGAPNSAPILSLFSSGAAEGYIGQTGTDMVIGSTGGLPNYNDATLLSNAAIVIDASANNVRIGTAANDVATKFVVVATKTIASAAGAVYDGIKFAASAVSITGATGIATAAGFNFTTIQAPTYAGDTATCAIASAATLYVTAAPIAGANVTITAGQAIKVGAGSIVCQGAALATDATDGFLYIPTCAGAPTGVPTTQTGTVPLVFDTTNHKLYGYDGSWLAMN